MSNLIVEVLDMQEHDPFDVSFQTEQELNPSKSVEFKSKELNLGNTGFLESVNIRDTDNIELVFKDKVVKLKVRVT